MGVDSMSSMPITSGDIAPSPLELVIFPQEKFQGENAIDRGSSAEIAFSLVKPRCLLKSRLLPRPIQTRTIRTAVVQANTATTANQARCGYLKTRTVQMTTRFTRFAVAAICQNAMFQVFTLVD